MFTISITQRLGDDDCIFKGKEFFGRKSGKKDTGKENIFVRFASLSSRPPNSSANAKMLDCRADLAIRILALLSGVSWEEVQQGGVNNHEFYFLG